MILKLITVLLPWRLKRLALRQFFGYTLHPKAYIGLAWIFPRTLTMDEGSRIDHFNVAIHLDHMHLKKRASLNRGNWITGLSTRTHLPHFRHQPDRRAELIVGESSSITKNHHIDCTNRIEIGAFSTIAGYRSQLLTHSIDVFTNRQDSAPISIGDYAFVGTNVVILGGSTLPSRSVLGAKSLLNKAFYDEWTLYAGVPAKPLQAISDEAAYFSRAEGFVQ